MSARPDPPLWRTLFASIAITTVLLVSAGLLVYLSYLGVKW